MRNCIEQRYTTVKLVRHDDTVDVIRGIAIIMIFLVHYGQTFGDPIFTQFGQMGCQMFFVMSGYTCSISYSKNGVRNFWARRFLSIIPEYMTAVLVVVFANILAKDYLGVNFVGAGNTSLISVICNLLLLHGMLPFCNNSVFPGGWFIGTLVIMYLLHPLLEILYRKARFKGIFTGVCSIFAIAIGVCINYYVNNTFIIENNTFYYYFFTNEICCYFIGMYLYKALENNDNLHDDANFIRKIAIAVMTLLLTIFLFYSHLGVRYALSPLIMGIFTYALFFLLKKKNVICHLRNILQVLGKNSFFIFLTHTSVVWSFNKTMKLVILKYLVISDAFLFWLLLIPSVILVWVLSMILKQVVKYERYILGFWAGR